MLQAGITSRFYMLSGFLKRLEIACFLEFVLKSLTQRLYNPHLLKYCCLGNLVGNNQLTGGDTYDGWLLTKKWMRDLGIMGLAIVLYHSMKSNSGCSVKIPEHSPYS